MTTYDVEEIEDKIILALDTLIDTLGIRTVKTYQGELEADDISRIVMLFPAVYIVYGGSTYADHGARKVETLTFHVLVCDKSLRAEDEARRGGARNPGTYAMLEGVRDALYGSQLTLDIYPMKLVSQASIWFGDGVSVYGAQYETSQALLYPATV